MLENDLCLEFTILKKALYVCFQKPEFTNSYRLSEFPTHQQSPAVAEPATTHHVGEHKGEALTVIALGGLPLVDVGETELRDGK